MSSSEDDTVRLWDVETGEELRKMVTHTQDFRSIAFSPDGKTLAGATGDNAVYLWDVQTCALLRTLKGHTKSVNDGCIQPGWTDIGEWEL